jgi:two-component system NarL family response regulator
LALKHASTQPLLIPLTEDPVNHRVAQIAVHIAISESRLERDLNNLLARSARFSVVKSSIGYNTPSDVRIIDQVPEQISYQELEATPQPKLLFIGVERSSEMMMKAVSAGAWAYVTASINAQELEETICSLVEHPGSPLLKQVASRKDTAVQVLRELSDRRDVRARTDKVENRLTDHQMRILQLVAQGETSKDIGELVGLGEQTIKNYLVKIFEKTNTRNRAHAVAFAAQNGWLLPLVDT